MSGGRRLLYFSLSLQNSTPNPRHFPAPHCPSTSIPVNIVEAVKPVHRKSVSAMEMAQMLRTPPIKVVVYDAEEEAKTYYIQKGFLVSVSPVFAAMVKNFREAEENQIVLRDDDPEAIEAILVMLICGGFSSYSSSSSSQIVDATYKFLESLDDPKNGSPAHAIDIRARIYVALDKYQMHSLTNEVMDATRALMSSRKTEYSNTTIAYIYDNTMEDSPLRTYARDLAAFNIFGNGCSIDRYAELRETCPDFAFDVLAIGQDLALRRTTYLPDPRVSNRLRYYDIAAYTEAMELTAAT